ncbi:hypothetical protein DPMN_157226 [Dreissena polymorpha]|uniref:Uncharacterized protein n=1 Tax=Dreissena polymorpha TaxID=45954 RepID=A0A9D4EGT8_DREPO|nr:hypothetical protein DPMN_157226 [Dreissena polymorpha]
MIAANSIKPAQTASYSQAVLVSCWFQKPFSLCFLLAKGLRKLIKPNFPTKRINSARVYYLFPGSCPLLPEPPLPASFFTRTPGSKVLGELLEGDAPFFRRHPDVIRFQTGFSMLQKNETSKEFFQLVSLFSPTLYCQHQLIGWWTSLRAAGRDHGVGCSVEP